MTTEASKAIVREYFEAYNRSDLEALKDILASGITCHVGGMTAAVQGLEANLRADAYVRAAFSDIHWDLLDLIGEGERVAARRGWSMTHTRSFEGVAPTQKKLSGTAVDVFRIEDGRIAEVWSESDNLSFMQQLGALPAVERAPGL